MSRSQAILLKTVGPGSVIQVTSVEDNDVSIRQSGRWCYAFIKARNIRINMVWHGFYMNFDIYVPRSACNLERAFGHLGRCDGKQGNDVSGFNDSELILDAACAQLSWQ